MKTKQRILVIDDENDVGEFISTAAQALGINGIVFHSVDKLQSALETHGLAESLAEAKDRSK